MTDPISKPVVEIHYCRKCRFLMRAGWMAQELLSTFGDDLGGVTLAPGEGGVFLVKLTDGTMLFDRKIEGRFPESKELKQRLRDIIAPDRNLGHSDKP